MKLLMQYSKIQLVLKQIMPDAAGFSGLAMISPDMIANSLIN